MITSNHNPKLKNLRDLLAHRMDREQSQRFVVEGVRLAEEALAAGWRTPQVFFSAQLSQRGRDWLDQAASCGAEVEEILPGLMDGLAETEAPQGLLAVFSMEGRPFPAAPDFLLVVDAVRDPGNLGTLLRSAAAAGVQAAVLAPQTVDAFSPKSLRAGMGAQFRLPVRSMDWPDIGELKKRAGSADLHFFLAEASGGTSLWQADFRQPTAVIVGGEAEGAGEVARRLADEQVQIPMPGQSESLNAAVAASIIFFEVVRQRSR